MAMMNNLPIVRLKGDQILLQLGNEECILKVTDGFSDDATHLAKTILNRINEVLAKRNRKLIQDVKEIQSIGLRKEKR